MLLSILFLLNLTLSSLSILELSYVIKSVLESIALAQCKPSIGL